MKIARFAVVLLWLAATVATADSDGSLSKAKLKQYFDVAPEFEALTEQYPSLSDEHTKGLLFKDQGQALSNYLADTPAYGDLNKIAKQAGFASIEEVVSVGARMMGAIYTVQKEMMPDMPSVAEQKKTLTAQTQQLQKMGMTEEMINQTIGKARESLAQIENLEAAAQHVTEQDKKVIRDNLEWVMDNLEQVAID